MKWRKLGHVWSPSGALAWARTHAYLPTAEWDGERLRVVVACLDDDRVGRLATLELDPKDPTRVLKASTTPVLDVGSPGTFDDCGVSPSCFIDVRGEKQLLYIGWQRTSTVPYLLFAGRARQNGDTFERMSSVPLLERTDAEPWVRSATTVIRRDGRYLMWYVSANRWSEINSSLVPEYVVRSAHSEDGDHWSVDAQPAIDYASPDEFGFGRPWAVDDGDVLRMWYSIRSRTRPYRIGYAESRDGRTFTRLDDSVGIAASDSGWDSEMICFPCVIDVGGCRFMFYNGNGHGATGFGVAELESN